MKKPRRGRPLKYGRPARVVAITLPEDTIHGLRQIDGDMGRAIVRLVDAIARPAHPLAKRPLVDYERLGRRRSLIVVDRQALTGLPGCELIPISADRALIALEDGRDLHHLELAILDRLADHGLLEREREGLRALRRALRHCRRANDIEVKPRSIFVVGKFSRPR